MFLILFNKKRISDSTLSSQQAHQQPSSGTDNQSIHEPNLSISTLTKFQLIKPNLEQDQQRLPQQQQQLPGTLITHFIIASAHLVNKIFIESLASVKRCLHITIQTLLTLLSSIANQCTESLGDSGAGASNGNLNSTRDADLIQPFTLSPAPRQGARSFIDSDSYLSAIAEASKWSEAAAATLEVAARSSSSSWTESRRSETIYYETVEPHSAYITTASEIAAAAADVNNDSYRSETIEMDFCRRRITQRAASNSLHHVVGSPTGTTPCYWDYQTPPTAVAAAFNAQTCTSVGPQVSGENKASESCRQLRREQLGTHFQGQQEQLQRSCGLQIDMEKCSGECPQQHQIILPQHQQQRYLKGQHGTQIPKNPKYPICVPQSSSSTTTSSSSASESVQNSPHHRQLGSRYGPMNFNAHSQPHSHPQEPNTKQYTRHQLQQTSRGHHHQNATTEVVRRASDASMVLVNKETISNLANQVAMSMNKMKDLEDRVRVLPELQRRLDNIVSGDSNSSNASDSNHHYSRSGSGGGSGGPKNIHNQNDTIHYHHNNHFQNMQDFSFSVDNVAAYHNDICNNNGAIQRGTNSNRPTIQDEAYKGIHPSLQRHYSSFRCATNNKTKNPSCISIRDSISNAQTTAGKFSLRSPVTGIRDFNCNGTSGDANFPNNHTNNSSRQSLPTSTSTTSMLRSNPNLNTNRSSSPKLRYEDIINDLISLSYSVNYPSSNTSLSNVQSTSGKRPEVQTKEHQAQHRAPEQDHQQASRRSSPAVSKLDCGCQSFKEHLRYNSISREQRMQHARSQSASYSGATSNSLTTSPQTTPLRNVSSKRDASTNTDLYMEDIVTRRELNELVTNMQRTYSTLSSIASRDDETTPIQFKSFTRKSSSSPSGSTSGSMSGPKSSSPLESRSDSCEDEQVRDNEENPLTEGKSEPFSNKGSVDENDNSRLQISDDNDDDDDDDEEEDEEEDTGGNCSNAGSLNGEGPYSLGSSYQDPSDFEEYCAYGESLDRRTKDFMSQSTKIPNDLRFALIRLNDIMKRNHSFEQIESSSSCVEVIRKEWFLVAANKDSQPSKTKLYIDYFESFTKQLLNTVVNLCDNAGNTAMHYAASLYKLDIIKVLLETKVCDVNCRNKAGYTPIMLLALADITKPEDQEIAKHLFSIGDVNIKARASGQTAIMLAASHGRISTCRLLLESGADPSIQDFDGSTALMCGSEIGNEEVVRSLLAHKLTDPNAVDNDGLDALTIAMNNGHKNIGLILYAAKNVPRMVRSTFSSPMYNNSSGYLGASLRRSRGKLATNYVRRADSLLGPRSSRLTKLSQS